MAYLLIHQIYPLYQKQNIPHLVKVLLLLGLHHAKLLTCHWQGILLLAHRLLLRHHREILTHRILLIRILLHHILTHLILAILIHLLLRISHLIRLLRLISHGLSHSQTGLLITHHPRLLIARLDHTLHHRVILVIHLLIHTLIVIPSSRLILLSHRNRLDPGKILSSKILGRSH